MRLNGLWTHGEDLARIFDWWGGCLRPRDSLWDGAHDARLTGDVVDEIPGGKVDRADWSGVPDDLGDGVCPHHKLSLPYRALSSCQIAQVFKDDATRICSARGAPCAVFAVGTELKLKSHPVLDLV